MPLGDRIVVDPEVPAGKPVIRGTRLAVEFWNSWPQASQRTTSWPAIRASHESAARIFLTLDKDFWQIAVQRRSRLEKSGVVLFRIHPARPANLR